MDSVGINISFDVPNEAVPNERYHSKVSNIYHKQYTIHTLCASVDCFLFMLLFLLDFALDIIYEDYKVK